MANRSDGRKFLTTGRPPDNILDGIGSKAAFLGGEGASEYNGFWNGINGKPVRIGTAPAREAQASRG